MRLFVQKPCVTRTAATAKHMLPGRFRPGLHLELKSILHSHSAIGIKAVDGFSPDDARECHAERLAPTDARQAYPDSQISVQPEAARTIQAKLSISAPGDASEQEADRVANHVAAASAIPAGETRPPRIQSFARQPADQRLEAPATVLRLLASPGQPLEARLRRQMERHFGHDFSRVRLHTGPAAAESANDLNALAYAAGNSIVFAAGQFDPSTHAGRRLLAHELTHVVQQSRCHSQSTTLVQRNEDDRTLAEISKRLSAVVEELGQLRSVAADLVEGELGNRPASTGKIEAGLKGIEKRGGAKSDQAKRLRNAIDRLAKQADQLRRDRARARGIPFKAPPPSSTSPASNKATSTKSGGGNALAEEAAPGVPTTKPAPRPTSAWKAGLKAGGKALGVALLFAGLGYLVQRKLGKDLDASIDKARHGAMPWAWRVKREDPAKPVYMRILVESKDYSRYVPLLGWMPETPVLHMIQIAMTRQEIDPPIIHVRDERLDLWHPGVTTTVTYTELMVP